MADRRRGWRLWAFVGLCVAAALVAGGYLAWAVRRGTVSHTTSETTSDTPADALAGGLRLLATPPARPYLIVRSTADATFRKLVLVPLAAPDTGYVTPLECERAYFGGDRGVCLLAETQGVTTTNYVDIFDEHFTLRHRLPLTGLPSRTRVSVDGRRAAVTVFEQGHSYADDGFSTRTTIVDTQAGRQIADLEQFVIRRDGQRFRAADFNFWGVTFARDGNRFYATLASGGSKYLIEGSVDARAGRVVRADVECPSLSPDGTRIAYKHVIGPSGGWQLRIYDLRTGSDTLLTREERSVDDQVEWLDDDHVMYHISGARGADIWVLGTDNTESPRMLLPYAYSPAVVR